MISQHNKYLLNNIWLELEYNPHLANEYKKLGQYAYAKINAKIKELIRDYPGQTL